MTGFPLILTIALAAAFVLVAVGLIVSLLYYKGRLVDSHRTLARIIKENLELHEKLEDTSLLLVHSGEPCEQLQDHMGSMEEKIQK